MQRQEERLSTHALFGVAVGVAAAMLVLVFFAPRLVVWRSWWVAPDAFYGPEVGRAASVVWQAKHLGAPIPDDIHEIIRWRLLFPAIAKLSGIPTFAHLGLYGLGAIVAVVYAATLFRGPKIPSWASIAAAVAFSANAWFFTSTGWLGYSDGWVALGLLLVAFSAHSTPALLAGFLLPWADDRFALAMPLAIACRIFFRGSEMACPAATTFRQAALVSLGPAVFITARAILESLPSTRSSQGYGFPPFRGQEVYYLWGAWEAWRCCWLPAAIAAVSTAQGSGKGRERSRRFVSVALLALIPLTLSSALFTAYDVSRAGVTLTPLVVAGMRKMLTCAAQRRWLVMIAAGNLLLPATHVVINIQLPVRTLMTEISILLSPPPPYAVRPYATRAVQATHQGDWQSAERNLSVAARLDPHDPDVIFATVIVLLAKGNEQDALAFLIQRSSGHPEHRVTYATLAEHLYATGHPHFAHQVARVATDGLGPRDPLVIRLNRLAP